MTKIWEFEDLEKRETVYKVILKFANSLRDDTNGVIEGIVTETTTENNPEIVYGFYLTVPKLRNYSYRLFEFRQSSIVEPYTVYATLYAKDPINNQFFESNTVPDFERKLLGWIKNPITKLVMQSIKVHMDIMDEYQKD
ncbi:MAG: hypothetical protein WCJ03_06530 [Bacteroidales bacterium]